LNYLPDVIQSNQLWPDDTIRQERRENDIPDYLKIVVPSVAGFITTICAAFLSTRRAVRRAYQERWWDRKEQAYREIVDALHDMLRYSSFEADRDLNGDRGDNPKEKDFALRYSEACWTVQRMTDIGYFVISQKAADILQKLRNRPKLEWGDGTAFEVREQEASLYREALDGIRECAGKDLKVGEEAEHYHEPCRLPPRGCICKRPCRVGVSQ
jgi:hypothetical protein